MRKSSSSSPSSSSTSPTRLEFQTIINWSQRTYCRGLTRTRLTSAALRVWHEMLSGLWVTLGHDQAGQARASTSRGSGPHIPRFCDRGMMILLHHHSMCHAVSVPPGRPRCAWYLLDGLAGVRYEMPRLLCALPSPTRSPTSFAVVRCCVWYSMAFA